jgi:medium-chain acyl-[acyl-carrier-protein] hydrolase
MDRFPSIDAAAMSWQFGRMVSDCEAVVGVRALFTTNLQTQVNCNRKLRRAARRGARRNSGHFTQGRRPESRSRVTKLKPTSRGELARDDEARGAGSVQSISKWFVVPRRRPDPRARLFCIPYAGAGATVFVPWAVNAGLAADIELCCIQLPGREQRFTEPAVHRIAPLVAAIADAMLPKIDLPYAIFGHSLGGYVAFELVRRLRWIGAPLPALVMPSGVGAPDLPQPFPPVYDLPRAELFAFLVRHTGTPAHVFEDEDLLELTLPVLRADLEVTDTYVYEPEPPLPCAITAFAGNDDGMVSDHDLAGWQRHTSGQFRQHRVSGNHMYPASPDAGFFGLLNRELAIHLAGADQVHRREDSRFDS